MDQSYHTRLTPSPRFRGCASFYAVKCEVIVEGKPYQAAAAARRDKLERCLRCGGVFLSTGNVLAGCMYCGSGSTADDDYIFYNDVLDHVRAPSIRPAIRCRSRRPVSRHRSRARRAGGAKKATSTGDPDPEPEPSAERTRQRALHDAAFDAASRGEINTDGARLAWLLGFESRGGAA